MAESKWVNFRDKLPKNGTFTVQKETPKTPEKLYKHLKNYILMDVFITLHLKPDGQDLMNTVRQLNGNETHAVVNQIYRNFKEIDC
jgi:hypothetical protein